MDIFVIYSHGSHVLIDFRVGKGEITFNLNLSHGITNDRDFPRVTGMADDDEISTTKV